MEYNALVREKERIREIREDLESQVHKKETIT